MVVVVVELADTEAERLLVGVVMAGEGRTLRASPAYEIGESAALLLLLLLP